jgi:hypothetical protein
MTSCPWVGFFLASLVTACSFDRGEPPVSVGREAVVYGPDDRLDVFEQPDQALRQLASSSIVALVHKDLVEQGVEGPRLVISQTAHDYGLCSKERFAEQPVVATCSGVLLADDVVLTAAHCLTEGGNEGIACSELVMVFDYFYEAAGQLAQLHDGAIYTCRKVLALEHHVGAAHRVDYALIQLDRPVSRDREPIAISQRGLTAAEPLATISFPLGLPAKIDSNARVVDPRLDHSDYFSLASDVFEGSSGGAVVNSDAELVGILSSGGNDFAQADAGCVTPAVVPEADRSLSWELASYTSPAVDALCRSGWSGPRLCEASVRRGKGCSVMRTQSSSAPAYLWLACAITCTWRRRNKRSGQRGDRGSSRELVVRADGSAHCGSRR